MAMKMSKQVMILNLRCKQKFLDLYFVNPQLIFCIFKLMNSVEKIVSSYLGYLKEKL